MWVRIISFCFWVALSITMLVLSHHRNAARPVKEFQVQIDKNLPPMISKDSVNKMLKFAFKDSVSKQKSEINLKRLELQLAQNNLIEQTEAFLTLNDVLHIKVMPRIPVARVLGDKQFFLDANGVPLPLSPTHNPEVPVITSQPDVDRYAILSNLSLAITEDDFFAAHIGGIRDDSDGIYMDVNNQDYKIKLKSMDDVKKKFKMYKAFYAAAIDQKFIGDYREVIIDNSNQIICKRIEL